MKVLELTCEPILYGGQEAFIFNVLDNIKLDELDIDVLTLYYCDSNKYKTIAEKNNSRIYELNLDFRPGKSRSLIKKPLKTFLKTHKYDLVHIHSGSISALAYSAEVAKKSGIKKVVVHSHSTGVNNLKHKLIQTAFSMKFPRSTWNRINVLNNGININDFSFDPIKRDEIRSQLSISDDDYLVGHIGRFTQEKNQKFTVDISNKLRDNDNLRFLFIGDGEMKEELVDKSKDNRNTIFLDSQDSIWEYYNALDVLVLPSIYEGIPIVSIEAQTNGLPIIASTGVSHEIEINENVKRVDLQNIDEWTDLILNRRMRRIDNTDNKIINSSWNITNVVDSIVLLYENLMSNNA